MKPPLGLSAVATNGNGNERTWWSGARRHDRAQQIKGGTRVGEGFADGGCLLSRDIRRDWDDINLYDSVTFVCDDGSIAYEGRIGADPRDTQNGHSIQLQLAGWMAHASADAKLGPLTYVNRDQSRWGGASNAYRMAQLAYAISDASSRTDDSGNSAIWTALDTGGSSIKPLCVGVFDAGPDNPIGSLSFGWQRVSVDNTDTNHVWYALLGTDDAFASQDSSGNLRAAGPGTGSMTATTGDRRYALLAWSYSISGSWPSQVGIVWPGVAVYGTNDLTIVGGGYIASDVMRDIAQRFCPKLSTAGIEETALVIPHIDFPDRVSPYDAFKVLNGPHNYELAVWEDRTLTFRPYDLSDYDWQVTTDQPGVDVSNQGTTTQDLANYAVVEFDNVDTGKRDQVGPWTASELEDTSVGNPANQHGLSVELTVSLSNPATAALAVEFGSSYLSEFNRPKNRGQIRVTGHIKDNAGHWQQYFKPRYGQTISVVDDLNDSPRLITATDWDDATKTATISTDNGELNMMDAVVDYVHTNLVANGLA